MKRDRIPRITLVAILVALTAALIARQVVRIELAKYNIDAAFAKDLSYLAVPLVLIAVLFPLWRSEKNFLASQFRRIDLSWRIVWTAVAVGILIRGAWWSQLIARVSFGIQQSDDPTVIAGPAVGFQCPAPIVVAVGLFVSALLTPIIEEIVHRAYVLSALRHRGAIISVLVSALVFAIFHHYAAWPFAFFAGVVLGVQYWIARSLWQVVITHATVNGLILLDWHCLSVQWNPSADKFPIMTPGIIASISLAACLCGIFFLLQQMAIGARSAPIATR